ncbi:MAG: hypothetical protein V5A79_07735 [Candidatus Bipolaricaulota bacterium]
MLAANRKFLIIALLLVLALGLVSSSVMAKLAVAPLSLILELKPGESTTKELSIHNTGEEPIEVSVELMDWWRSPSGDLQVKQPDTLDRSCADWVLYSPSSLSLQPGEREQVSVELSVPNDATGDHWALLLASEKPQPVEEEQPVTTRISISYAIKILQKDPTNRVKEAKITNIELNQSSPLKLTIAYENSGSAHLQTTGKVEIRDLQGETVKEIAIDKFPTLPGEKRDLTLEAEEDSEKLEPGDYYVIATMDFGGDRLIQGGLPIEIPKGEEEAED